MLPVNIIANWCRAAATLDDFRSVLHEYVEGAEDREYPENTHAINWLERTLFTFGDSEWSHNEGSLIFENRRVALWKEDSSEQNQAHLIFIALFPSSLVHLQQSITSLMKETREVEVLPTTFDLLEAVRSFSPEVITGAEVTNSNNERTIFSGVFPFTEQPLSYMLHHLLRSDQEQLSDSHVSRLFIRTNKPKVDFTLSSGGVITFNNPDLTIGEIVHLISKVAEAIPVRAQERGNLRLLRETKREVIQEREIFYEEE